MLQSDVREHGRTGPCPRCGGSATPKVLCVDDNAAFLSAFAAVLELAGFAVTTASDPAQGLALVKRSTFDLAILDYHMPGMTGAQLGRKIHRSRPSLPMMLLSANESVPAAELRVFNRYVAKGENVQEVLLAVRGSLTCTNRKVA
jgi:CheY-like chemotaxis protein